MTYEELKNLIKGFEDEDGWPISGVNEDGENVQIVEGENGGGKFIETQTFQKNGWCRISTYWEDGTYEEGYER